MGQIARRQLEGPLPLPLPRAAGRGDAAHALTLGVTAEDGGDRQLAGAATWLVPPRRRRRPAHRATAPAGGGGLLFFRRRIRLALGHAGGRPLGHTLAQLLVGLAPRLFFRAPGFLLGLAPRLLGLRLHFLGPQALYLGLVLGLSDDLHFVIALGVVTGALGRLPVLALKLALAPHP